MLAWAWYYSRSMPNARSRCKRKLNVWVNLDLYAKLRNLAEQRACSMSEIVVRFLEHETVGVPISDEQAQDIKVRAEGDPLWALGNGKWYHKGQK